MNLTRFNSTLRYESHALKLSPLCSTEYNKYTPLIAVHNGVFIKRGDNKGILYSPYMTDHYSDRARADNTGRKLFPNIINGIHSKIWVNGDEYYTLKHMLYQVDVNYKVKIIYTLAFETEYLIDTLSKKLSLQPERSIAIINKQFINDPANVNLKRRLMIYLEKDVSEADILFTNHINEICFNDKVKIPTFTTVIDRINYIDKLKKEVNGTS